MAPYFPPPDKDKLLLPLLACLPIAFVSSRPPPALLPLLSPILRQRVKFLADSGSSDSTWLPLLCWESADASELPNIVETVSFEPHPVSGEVEFGETERIQYRKLDEETLQSIIRLPDVNLEVIYLWCEGDQEGGEDGWRLNELRPLHDSAKDKSRPWYNTVSAADVNYRTDAEQSDAQSDRVSGLEFSTKSPVDDAGDNDDAYWAQYDRSNSQTPAQRLTPGPPPRPSAMNEIQEENDYYARYGSVQPQMDHDDPSADREAVGHSSLDGNTLSGALASAVGESVQKSLAELNTRDDDHIIHTRASSPSSSAVSHLEQAAQHQSQAEVAIQQHISTTMKSLYRLTRGAGIECAEFRRLVQNELDLLGMMDEYE